MGVVDEIAKDTDMHVVGSPGDVHGIHPELRKSNIAGINEFIFQREVTLILPVNSLSRTFPCAVHHSSHTSPRRWLYNKKPRISVENAADAVVQKMEAVPDRGCHEDLTEWRSLSFTADERAHISNLEVAGESNHLGGDMLWNNGGVAALNDAIDRAVDDGYEWTVHLDDDDFWDSDHLANIVTGIRTGATFVLTGAQHLHGFLPFEREMLRIRHDIIPRPCQIPHSAVAFNAKLLTSRYEVSSMPADANMWARVVLTEVLSSACSGRFRSSHWRKGVYVGVLGVRRFLLAGHKVPAGWYSDTGTGADSTLTPPSLLTSSLKELVQTCRYVVGPTTSSNSWRLLPKNEVPYHIAVVESLEGLNVWEKI